MKKLTLEDLQHFDQNKAWEIVHEIGKYFTNRNPHGYYMEFEDELPWDKQSSLLALSHLLKSEKNKNLKENLASSIVIIGNYLPNPQEYERIIQAKNIRKDARAGMTFEEVRKKYFNKK